MLLQVWCRVASMAETAAVVVLLWEVRSKEARLAVVVVVGIGPKERVVWVGSERGMKRRQVVAAVWVSDFGAKTC